jgi:UPF0755 protein
MTDYGRDSGSEQWHPEDPLFGDQWGDQQQYQQNQTQHQQQHHQQNQTQQQHQQNEQQQYQQQHGGWHEPYANGQQQYQQQPQYQQQYAPEQYAQPQYAQPQSQQWDTATYGTGQGDPYADPYGGQQQPDFYGQGGYPPPQPPPYEEQQAQQTQQQPRQQQQQEPLTDTQQAPSDWDADAEMLPDDTEHAFFSGGQDDEAEDEDDAPGRRAGKKRGAKGQGGKKRRSGMACLVVLLVLGGGVGTVGYFGYTFYQGHFGPAPDFSGSGKGDVQIEVPAGSSGVAMGNILKKAGVVKSVTAFTDAAEKNPKGRTIQPGIYILHKEMSGASAVTMMLNPKAQSFLIVAEGTRDAKIYAAIDTKLKLAAGTTKAIAKAQAKKLGLPSWANDNPKIKDPLEGFLYPTRYSVGAKTTPADLLRQMVTQASNEYAKTDLKAEAKKLGLDSPLQVITVASLVQAEGKTDSDFAKMARVVYNRLKPTNTETNGKLEFDSTFNYLKNQSKINISLAEIRNDKDPYNTYVYKGLPPGPIGNPGAAALNGALDPEQGGWYYFVSVDGKTTQFANTLAEHDKLVQEFNAAQKKKNGQ